MGAGLSPCVASPAIALGLWAAIALRVGSFPFSGRPDSGDCLRHRRLAVNAGAASSGKPSGKNPGMRVLATGHKLSDPVLAGRRPAWLATPRAAGSPDLRGPPHHITRRLSLSIFRELGLTSLSKTCCPLVPLARRSRVTQVCLQPHCAENPRCSSRHHREGPGTARGRLAMRWCRTV